TEYLCSPTLTEANTDMATFYTDWTQYLCSPTLTEANTDMANTDMATLCANQTEYLCSPTLTEANTDMVTRCADQTQYLCSPTLTENTDMATFYTDWTQYLCSPTLTEANTDMATFCANWTQYLCPPTLTEANTDMATCCADQTQYLCSPTLTEVNTHIESTEELTSTRRAEENSPLWLPGYSNGYLTNGLADQYIGEDISTRKRGSSNDESEDGISSKRARRIEEEFQDLLPLHFGGDSTEEDNLLASINLEKWDWGSTRMVEATNIDLDTIGTADNDNNSINTDPLAWEIIVPEEAEAVTPIHRQTFQIIECQNKEETEPRESSKRWTNWEGKPKYNYKKHKGQFVFHKGEAKDAETIQQLEQSKAALNESFSKSEACKLGKMLQDRHTSSLARKCIGNYRVDQARRMYELYKDCTEEEMKDGWSPSSIWKRPKKDILEEQQRRATLKAAQMI
ncbi:8463_t:CDS:1, partial [Paraglomus occultum]